MTNPAWDLKVSLRTFKSVLKNSKDERFTKFFARTLARVPFREAFHHYITKQQFKKYYPKMRKHLKSDLLGISRIEFWDFLYRKV